MPQIFLFLYIRFAKRKKKQKFFSYPKFHDALPFSLEEAEWRSDHLNAFGQKAKDLPHLYQLSLPPKFTLDSPAGGSTPKVTHYERDKLRNYSPPPPTIGALGEGRSRAEQLGPRGPPWSLSALIALNAFRKKKFSPHSRLGLVALLHYCDKEEIGQFHKCSFRAWNN